MSELATLPGLESVESAPKRDHLVSHGPEGKLMLAPVEPFKQHGQSGAWVSDFLPYTASIADELCFVKSLHTDAVNHTDYKSSRPS